MTIEQLFEQYKETLKSYLYANNDLMFNSFIDYMIPEFAEMTPELNLEFSREDFKKYSIGKLTNNYTDSFVEVEELEEEEPLFGDTEDETTEDYEPTPEETETETETVEIKTEDKVEVSPIRYGSRKASRHNIAVKNINSELIEVLRNRFPKLTSNNAAINLFIAANLDFIPSDFTKEEKAMVNEIQKISNLTFSQDIAKVKKNMKLANETLEKLRSTVSYLVIDKMAWIQNRPAAIHDIDIKAPEIVFLEDCIDSSFKRYKTQQAIVEGRSNTKYDR